MEELKKQIKQMLEEDLRNFEGYVQEAKAHKVKMLNPKISTRVIVSVGVCEYIKTLEKRLNI